MEPRYGWRGSSRIRPGISSAAAVDHFVGYGNVREGGLADLPGALARVMAGGPDYVSIQPGAAQHLWPQYAGKAALVIQAGCFTPDDRIRQLIATPEDAVRYGADALAVAIPVRGATEGEYIRWLTDTVNAAARFEMPVIAHIYPRDFSEAAAARSSSRPTRSPTRCASASRPAST